MNGFIQVTHEEYLAFVKNYPNKLEFDCTGICEPPLGSYNDFSGGKVWPDSMVAKEVRDWMGPNGETDSSLPGKFWRYYIAIPHAETMKHGSDNTKIRRFSAEKPDIDAPTSVMYIKQDKENGRRVDKRIVAYPRRLTEQEALAVTCWERLSEKKPEEGQMCEFAYIPPELPSHFGAGEFKCNFSVDIGGFGLVPTTATSGAFHEKGKGWFASKPEHTYWRLA